MCPSVFSLLSSLSAPDTQAPCELPTARRDAASEFLQQKLEHLPTRERSPQWLDDAQSLFDELMHAVRDSLPPHWRLLSVTVQRVQQLEHEELLAFLVNYELNYRCAGRTVSRSLPCEAFVFRLESGWGSCLRRPQDPLAFLSA